MVFDQEPLCDVPVVDQSQATYTLVCVAVTGTVIQPEYTVLLSVREVLGGHVDVDAI